jgi:hypothetical protein
MINVVLKPVILKGASTIALKNIDKPKFNKEYFKNSNKINFYQSRLNNIS